ncbi:MAG: hypothetical protein WD602_03550 [Actinomycetota bacterium]
MYRPFAREQGKSRFRATYQVTDVPTPGCVQVTVTLATRIQLSQEIARRGVKYTESLLAECSKELVKAYLERGGRPDPECADGLSDAVIALSYNDFDMLAEAAVSLSQ